MHREKINEDKWLRNFSDLQEYLNTHQECSISDIPPDYRTKHNVLLARWLYEQQKFYYGCRENNTLPDKQRELLESIGIEEYRTISDTLWFERFEELKKFYAEYRTLQIPTDYTCNDGTLLVNWTRRQRKKYHDGTLKKKYIIALENAGFMEILETNEERGLRHAKEYYEKFGNLEIPYKYVCEDGYKLGVWICTVRDRKATVSAEIIKELNKMKMIWNVPDMRWFTAFSDCERFYRKNGNLLIPATYPSRSGIDLRNWIAQNRQSYVKGKLSQEKINMLNRIGALNSKNV